MEEEEIEYESEWEDEEWLPPSEYADWDLEF